MMLNRSQRVRRLLIDEFAACRRKNPRYSLRAFANRLGVVPSALSDWMAGKRAVSPSMAERVMRSLNLDSRQTSLVLGRLRAENHLLKVAHAAAGGSPEKAFTLLESDTYHVIADWYYFAVLSLAETTAFVAKPDWIAERLGISQDQARDALERLMRLKLLVMDTQGKVVPTGRQLRTTSDVPDATLRRCLHQNLERARESLDRDPVEVRDFSSITMAIDPDLLPEAKALIQKFRRNLCQLLESGAKREVYKMNIELFPLTSASSAHDKT